MHRIISSLTLISFLTSQITGFAFAGENDFRTQDTFTIPSQSAEKGDLTQVDSGSISEGTVVYFDQSRMASSSSTRVSHPHTVGEVKKILKTGRAEIQPIQSFLDISGEVTINGVIRMNAPRVFLPTSDLVPSLSRLDQFAVGDFVQIKRDSSKKGYLRQIFANGISQIAWSHEDSRIESSQTSLVRLQDVIKVEDIDLAPHSRGMKKGDIVFFYHGDQSLEKVKKLEGLDLAIFPHVGRITDFASADDPNEEQVTLQVEKKLGLDVKGNLTLSLPAKALYRKVNSLPSESELKEGDPVTYSSDRGIQPYHFQGQVERIFENGIAEIRWADLNGKEYNKENRDYLPVKSLRPRPGSGVENVHGVSVLDGEQARFIALRSVERGLKEPPVSYLKALDTLVHQRATQVCVNKGLKGLAAEPTLVALEKSEQNLPLYLAGGDSFEHVVDQAVGPWKFRKVNRRTTASTVLEYAAFITPGVTATTMPLLLLPFMLGGVVVGIGVLSGGVGLAAIPVAAWGAYIGYQHRSISNDRAIERMSEGKKVRKRYDVFSKQIPTLVFRSIVCAEQEADVIESIPIRQVEIGPTGGINSLPIVEWATPVSELGEKEESLNASDDLPPPYEE